MSDTRWERMWDLFHACVDLPPAERKAKLEAECADEPEMLAEIRELLAEHDRPRTSLEQSGARLAGEFSPGDRVGPYTIEALIGEGGMGLVYRATQTEPVKRTVALKVIRPGMDSREVLARFRLERESLALLEHPNIARVHDADSTPEGRPYFAMEFVDGDPVTTYCIEKELSVEQRLEMFEAICRGVQHAHQRGIIHRDLKPSNVLVPEVDGKPVPKIIDFGIARATEQVGGTRTFATELGRLIGTPEYMSPEQAGFGETDIDTRTDVYSLGVLLYELLAGAQPFDWAALRRKGLEEMRRILYDVDPPPPSERITQTGGTATTGIAVQAVAGDLDWIVLKALEKDRERRYDSPSALAEDIERYRNDLPIEARPPSRMYRLKKFTRRHRLGVTAASAVVLALVAGLAFGTIGFARAVEARKKAQEEARTAEHVTSFMSQLFFKANPGNQAFDSITLRQAIDRGAELLKEELRDEPAVRARLLFEIGASYRANGVYPQASAMLDESLALLGAEDHELRWTVLAHRGFLENDMGRYAEARVTLERAIEGFREHKGEGNSGVILTMQTLGGVYGHLELYAEQRRVAERVLEVYEQTPWVTEVGIAKATYELALAMAREGTGDEVEETLEKAIGIFEKESESVWAGYAYNSLAILYWNRKEFERALPFMQGAYETTRRTHGEEHPYTASTMNNFGLLYLELERYDEARELSEKAHDLRLKVLGPDHPDLATSQLNLARLYAETGERDKAAEFFERGLDVRSRALGEKHSSMVGPLRRYAELLTEWGQADKARGYQERADAIELVGPTSEGS